MWCKEWLHNSFVQKIRGNNSRIRRKAKSISLLVCLSLPCTQIRAVWNGLFLLNPIWSDLFLCSRKESLHTCHLNCLPGGKRWKRIGGQCRHVGEMSKPIWQSLSLFLAHPLYPTKPLAQLVVVGVFFTCLLCWFMVIGHVISSSSSVSTFCVS